MTANRKDATKNKAKKFVAKKTAGKVELRDSDKEKKYEAQEEFLVNTVKDRVRDCRYGLENCNCMSNFGIEMIVPTVRIFTTNNLVQ